MTPNTVSAEGEPEAAPADADLELALLAKALGHPARVHILRLLLARDTCCCGELVDQLPLAQATVSQHLKILKDAGLLQGTIDGVRSCYCLDTTALGELRRALDARLARLGDSCFGDANPPKETIP
jgi:ArsR family transcriptional regulator, arsenate/arsenite/antimonite-responsive transcriptional repressor